MKIISLHLFIILLHLLGAIAPQLVSKWLTEKTTLLFALPNIIDVHINKYLLLKKN